MIDTSGAKQDWRGSQPRSPFMGYDQNGTPSNGNPGGDNRAFNTTTIRYALNDKKNKGGGNGGWVDGNIYSGNGVSGVGYNFGNNTPLNSAHPGGVMFLFGDGSVRFLTDCLPLATLQQLATRDDGQVVTLP